VAVTVNKLIFEYIKQLNYYLLLASKAYNMLNCAKQAIQSLVGSICNVL